MSGPNIHDSRTVQRTTAGRLDLESQSPFLAEGSGLSLAVVSLGLGGLFVRTLSGTEIASPVSAACCNALLRAIPQSALSAERVLSDGYTSSTRIPGIAQSCCLIRGALMR